MTPHQPTHKQVEAEANPEIRALIEELHRERTRADELSRRLAQAEATIEDQDAELYEWETGARIAAGLTNEVASPQTMTEFRFDADEPERLTQRKINSVLEAHNGTPEWARTKLGRFGRSDGWSLSLKIEEEMTSAQTMGALMTARMITPEKVGSRAMRERIEDGVDFCHFDVKTQVPITTPDGQENSMGYFQLSVFGVFEPHPLGVQWETPDAHRIVIALDMSAGDLAVFHRQLRRRNEELNKAQ